MKIDRLYFSTVIKQVMIWTIAFSLFNFLREFGHEIVRDVEEVHTFNFLQRVLFQCLLGLVSGILFGTYAYCFDKLKKPRLSFGKLLFIGALGYGLVIFIFILVAFWSFANTFNADIDSDVVKNYFISGQAFVLILYCFIVGFLVEFIAEIDKKFGPGNLLKMLLGRFYRPQQEERVFMFLDMRSSTTIAEKLGHIKYSRLLQDCYKDISVVIKYKSEIYQYVGDEAVLTWSKQKGFIDENCIRAYFSFIQKLKNRKSYYLQEYGILPEFKAGIHTGKITVAEVGEIKREIAYHGDTINTAARIQAQCNAYKENLLISKDVAQEMELEAIWEVVQKGIVMLKGKTKEVKIYAVNTK